MVEDKITGCKMKKNIIVKIIAFATLIMSAICVHVDCHYSEVVHVDAVRGSENGDGSATRPYNSIMLAKERVREINKNMQGDIFVDIAPGEYFLDEKLLQGQNLSVLLHQVFHGIKF